MKKDKDGKIKNTLNQRNSLSLGVILLNIVLLACVVLLYGRYAAVYQERLREENLGNIANLNQSAAINATTLIESWNTKLDDIAQFASLHDMTHDETLNFICDANSSESRQFELIGSDYNGYLARRDESGAFVPLSYEKAAYESLQNAMDDVDDAAYDDVCFAPEFTDGDTALKYFAIYRHIPLKNESGQQELYTLLLATKSSELLAVFNGQNDFEGQSTVLIESGGNYIVGNNDFKSTNFFQYLYVYNDLTLDQRKEIESNVELNEIGELYYKNASGQDCVFCFERMSTNGWYCVTCVPISSFRTPVFNFNYALYAVVALLLMLAVDVFWLRHVNRRLRLSVIHEMEASESKTDFLSRMSHDIRTPLNGIIGLTALAQDEPNPPRTMEYLDNIKVSGQFLTGLVNDILDMSKVESGKVELNPEPYSNRDLIKYVNAVVVPLCLEKGQKFCMSPMDDEAPVLLDRLRFNQVVFNLLSNAVKYTPDGGTIGLYWKRNSLPDGRAALEITVQDNGIGMSEEFQKHMFDSFSQERSQTATTGAGLGLAIVQSLVNLMNGRIDVESKQGKGSTFTIYLETEVCKESAETPENQHEGTLEGKRVLVCEDNKINILVVQRLLEKWGMAVDTAENGKIGVDLFADSLPGVYRVILMDVMMPELGGIDATKIIRNMDRADAKSVPIIAMTANAYSSDVKNCLDAGMNAHMSKPIDPDQLRSVLVRYTGE